MAQISSLASRIIRDHPMFTFEASDDFRWSAASNTIYIRPSETADDILTLLHEVAHARLRHDGYVRDIDLLKCERDAWSLVKNELSSRYDVTFDSEHAETMLDSYRDWLHARSTCPACSATGIQNRDGYRCVGCGTTWRANQAKQCSLRRYVTN